MDFHPSKGIHSANEMAMAIALTHHKLVAGKMQFNQLQLTDEAHLTASFDAAQKRDSEELHDKAFKPLEGDEAISVFEDVCSLFGGVAKPQTLQDVFDSEEANTDLSKSGASLLYYCRTLMQLADHYHSSKPQDASQGKSCVYANTDEKNKLKQNLNSHIIGVTSSVRLAAQALDDLRLKMPGLQADDIAPIVKSNDRFAWQSDCVELVRKAKELNPQAAFFTAIAADVGAGKSQACIRIAQEAYDGEFARITVASCMRTLTRQLHAEYATKLNVSKGALGLFVGGISLQHKHDEPVFGIDTQEGDVLLECDDQREIPASVAQINGFLDGKAPDHVNFISVPLLVCTTDYLRSAFEPHRGNHLIATQRIMSSDLILDEADAYALDNLLVMANLVGLYGRNLHLVSATLTAQATSKIYESWYEGYCSYCASRSIETKTNALLLTDDGQRIIPNSNTIAQQTQEFWLERSNAMKKRPTLRQAIEIECDSPFRNKLKQDFFKSIAKSIKGFHNDHHTSHDGKKISTGIIRFDLIDHCVKFGKFLAANKDLVGIPFRIVVMHGNFTNVERASKELLLSRILNRKGPEEDIFNHPEVYELLEENDEAAILIVTTSLAERGNDWDCDFCIMEPSNIHGLIQMAGRVNRHRRKCVDRPNIGIMQFALNDGGTFKTHARLAMEKYIGGFSFIVNDEWMNSIDIQPMLGDASVTQMPLAQIGLAKINDCKKQSEKFRINKTYKDLGRLCSDFYPPLRDKSSELTFSIMENGAVTKSRKDQRMVGFELEFSKGMQSICLDQRSRQDIYNDAVEKHGLSPEKMEIAKQVSLHIRTRAGHFVVSDALGVYYEYDNAHDFR